MRLSYRLIISLIIGITLVTFLFARSQIRAEKLALRKDLERRAEILDESLEEGVENLLRRGSRDGLQRLVVRFGNREHLAGVAVYDKGQKVFAVTPGLEDRLKSLPPVVMQAMKNDAGAGEFFHLGDRPMHAYAVPLHWQSSVVGALAIFHDTGYIEAESSKIWWATTLRVLVQTLLIVLTTLLIVRLSIVRPVARLAEWMRDLRAGRNTPRPEFSEELLKPLSQEVASLASSLTAARAAAEEEARLRDSGESLWTAERLRVHVLSKLQESRLFAVSNREPYEHVRRGKSIETVVPASGLVTALQPILRACDGTWVAQGTGDADRETVDRNDHLRAPPDNPQYTLRRVWLNKEEEEGFYFGFANEGLWPLCHIAHTRPIFRSSDWEYYKQVNEKFAEATLGEMEGNEHPAVLVQDYHFALLPRLIKQQRPDARVAIFWHIPWPNAESFSICPWQRDVLDGLLGADLVGFHIQSHCNNFLETVDRALECRIEWEHFAVNRNGHITSVKPFPISVEYNEPARRTNGTGSTYLERAALFKELGVEAVFLGVGVDRVDYTKGILERFRAIERFLEKRPAYRGQFTFVQIGAPSRTHIQRYHDLLAQVDAEAERINWRFQTRNWKPIVFLKRHHSHQEIEPYYRSADLCLVTSLHDGMNLVAKEFVASRQDNGGVLILSIFAGAAHELRDAVTVNPYDIEQVAEAIQFALEMDPEEAGLRMQHMRRQVREHNVYHWAGNLVTALSEIRIEAPQTTPLSSSAIGSFQTPA